jgi:hypothetical protein
MPIGHGSEGLMLPAASLQHGVHNWCASTFCNVYHTLHALTCTNIRCASVHVYNMDCMINV